MMNQLYERIALPYPDEKLAIYSDGVLAHLVLIHQAHLKRIHLNYHFHLLLDEPLGVSR